MTEPNLFALPPGVDFPAALIDGLVTRHGTAPEALARVTLIVNTRRMARRLRTLFDSGPPRLLPDIRLVSDIARWPGLELPEPATPLERRLQLARLIDALLDRDPTLAPRAALFSLADSLAALLDEMSGEGVAPEVIANLDVSDQSGHWQRAQSFLAIAQDYMAAMGDAPDAEALQRRAVEALIARWETTPPAGPIVLAGSTGSRGTTLMLMEAVARLPQGAVVLPGFDTHTTDWSALDAPLPPEDHPQYRFARLAGRLGIDPARIQPWHDTAPPSEARNLFVSLALRPAPYTDCWLAEGPALGDPEPAFRNVTLLEAPSPRAEAMAIALRLREAAHAGQTAALITPDRMLTRRVAAALDRWTIRPDDSAGMPLHLSPPGRLLRHVASLFLRKTPASALFELLKHPLTHGGADRGPHLLLTHDLELHTRAKGPAFPSGTSLAAWAAGHKDPGAVGWAQWVAETMTGHETEGDQPLATLVARHIALAEAIAAGAGATGSGPLWEQAAGRECLRITQALTEAAPAYGQISAQAYADLVGTVLSAAEPVRSPDTAHPGVLIWGTLEARVQGADLVILGGLNEGTWPEMPPPDPWLNRALRHQAGLLLPERRIGLSAHDFQQAIAAREVWLTRPVRSDDAETVPSRWLNRLTNLLDGLPSSGGRDALDAMRERGAQALRLVAATEAVDDPRPAARPAPRPPVAARPREISVTQVQTLIRDPYAIYAKLVLGLRPLDPLDRPADARVRGILTHEALEQFVKLTRTDPDRLTESEFLAVTETVFRDHLPWPSARALWLSRISETAASFVEGERERQAIAPEDGHYEAWGNCTLGATGVTIKGKADRIDIDRGGRARIYDYKTGKPPGKAQQEAFDKQLILEAAMVARGAFDTVGPREVAEAVFLSLKAGENNQPAPIDTAEDHWTRLEGLIARYQSPTQGYTARRALLKDSDASDYDQLSRYGEWDATDPPAPEDLT